MSFIIEKAGVKFCSLHYSAWCSKHSRCKEFAEAHGVACGYGRVICGFTSDVLSVDCKVQDETCSIQNGDELWRGTKTRSYKCHREGLICAWLRFYLTPKRFFSKRRINKSNHHHHQSASFPIEHRSSTNVCHMTLFWAVTPYANLVLSPHVLTSFCASMYVGMLLSFPSLWVPFRGILGHMFVRCIQFVASPSPCSLFYPFLYRSLFCLSSSRALQYGFFWATKQPGSLRHLLIKTCNFCFSL